MIDTEDYMTFLARGAAADVWKVYDLPALGDGRVVPFVTKVLRISPGDFGDGDSESSEGSEISEDESKDEKATWDSFVKTYREKTSEWAALRHPNIVEVYAYDQAHDQDLNLHVEFCSNGSVRDFIKSRTGKQVNKKDIISDVLAGLEYLHTRNPPIVHGNINAGKLFVDADGKTKLGEFGLAALCYPLAPLASSITFTGFSRWMSPELLDIDPDDDIPIVFTTSSDIWALGCTIFEIIAEKLPYSEYIHDVRIQRAILKGENPGGRDSLEGEDGCVRPLWQILESCWSTEPDRRPSAQSVLSRIFSD